MKTHEEILEERHEAYGYYMANAIIADDLERIMTGESINPANIYLKETNWAKLPPDMRQALKLIATKISRILTGDFNHLDSWDDIAGYASLVSDRLTSRGTYAAYASAPSTVEQPLGEQSTDPYVIGDVAFSPIEAAPSGGGAGR